MTVGDPVQAVVREARKLGFKTIINKIPVRDYTRIANPGEPWCIQGQTLESQSIMIPSKNIETLRSQLDKLATRKEGIPPKVILEDPPPLPIPPIIGGYHIGPARLYPGSIDGGASHCKPPTTTWGRLILGVHKGSSPRETIIPVYTAWEDWEDPSVLERLPILLENTIHAGFTPLLLLADNWLLRIPLEPWGIQWHIPSWILARLALTHGIRASYTIYLDSGRHVFPWWRKRYEEPWTIFDPYTPGIGLESVLSIISLRISDKEETIWEPSRAREYACRLLRELVDHLSKGCLASRYLALLLEKHRVDTKCLEALNLILKAGAWQSPYSRGVCPPTPWLLLRRECQSVRAPYRLLGSDSILVEYGESGEATCRMSLLLISRLLYPTEFPEPDALLS